MRGTPGYSGSAWCLRVGGGGPGLAGLLLVSVLAGCTTRHYRKSADKESYRAIKAKSPKVPNMDPRFTIEQTNLLSFEGLPVTSSAEEFLGLEAERERGAHILNLEEALRLAQSILKNGPLAVAAALEAVRRGLELPLEAGLRLESGLFGILAASEDMHEGLKAFLEKRPARFQRK